MIKINQIKLPVGHTEKELHQKVAGMLHLNQDTFTYKIVKQSLDARKKPNLFYIYTVHVKLVGKSESEIVRKCRSNDVSLTEVKAYKSPQCKKSVDLTPVIVGSGPAGLFAAYTLAKAGIPSIVLERGEAVDERKKTVESFWETGILNEHSNVQFGEGGAGTFSDGKLNTLVKDPTGKNQFVLETFVKYGADPRIQYMNKPHLGTDELIHIVRNMRNDLIQMGCQFLYQSQMTDLIIENGSVSAVCINHERQIETNKLILAIGHSARDTFELLKQKQVCMEKKSFAVGIRIEHPQTQIDLCQYGESEQIKSGRIKLPAADYKLTNRAKNGRNVYSFCMCPGGYVVNASSEKGMLAVNGMSYSGRSGENANSAIIVNVTPADFMDEDVLAGIRFQRTLEKKAYNLAGGRVPIQLFRDFKMDQCSSEFEQVIPCTKGMNAFANLRELFSDEINEALIESIQKFGYTMKGFDRNDAVMSGVESRTSSPVRILRNEYGESNVAGLYPCGEGAGYAGGITSAAMDGIRIAEHLIENI